jgi:hypothetical protein
MRRHRSHLLSRRGTVVAVLVLGGLIASVVVGISLMDHPTADDLPGIALGSELVLAVERSAALFVAWLLALVVVDRALMGQLPSEMSGRGVKYADGARTDQAVLEVQAGIGKLDDEMAELRDEVLDLRRSATQPTIDDML